MNRYRGVLLAVLLIFLALPAWAQSDWFTEESDSATALAARAPSQTQVFFSCAISRQLVQAMLDDVDAALEQVPPEDREDFGNKEMQEVRDWFAGLSGLGFVAVMPAAGQTTLIADEPPMVVAAIGLTRTAEVEKLAEEFLADIKHETKRAHQVDWRVIEGTFHVGWDSGWLYFATTGEAMDRMMAARDGSDSLLAGDNFSHALRALNLKGSDTLFYMDIAAQLPALDLAPAEGVDDVTREGLGALRYAVLSLDVEHQLVDGLLGVHDNNSEFAAALLTPGGLGSLGVRLTPMGVGTFSSTDLKWIYELVMAAGKLSPAFRSQMSMLPMGLGMYGDPFQAFTGEVATSSNAIEMLALEMERSFEENPYEGARRQGKLTACKSNLKNIGTACEMYSTDWSGRYPEDMGPLTPNYLRTIPTCPAAGRDTYTDSYESSVEPDMYTFFCKGKNHDNVLEDHPRYNAMEGLIEGTAGPAEPEPEPEPEPERPSTDPTHRIALPVKDIEAANGLSNKLLANFRPDSRSDCKSNLKNIGTALEMYSTDYEGYYPEELGTLTPNYLKTIPDCPAAGRSTYSYTVDNEKPTYKVVCRGKNHPELAVDHPYYTYEEGIFEGEVDESAIEVAESPPLQAGEVRVLEFNHPIYREWTLLLDNGDEPTLRAGYGPLHESYAKEVPDEGANLKRNRVVSEQLAWAGDGLVHIDYANFEPLYRTFMKMLEKEDEVWAHFVSSLLQRFHDRSGVLEGSSVLVVGRDGLRYRGVGNTHATVAAGVALGAAIMVPNFIRARAQGQTTACKSNLKNIGTACEMYSTDWGGRYPEDMGHLTPNYLRTIPTCPSAGFDTYTESYTVSTNPDYYHFCCKGKHHDHVGLPEDHPSYNSNTGLEEY